MQRSSKGQDRLKALNAVPGPASLGPGVGGRGQQNSCDPSVHTPRTQVWPAQEPRGQGREPAPWRDAYCPLTWPPSASSPHSEAFPK